MFNNVNTRFYNEYGNLSYEFDDEHHDHDLAQIEFNILAPHLKYVENALHLCSGAGRHLAVFSEKGIPSIGIDISPFLIQQAASFLKRTPSAPLKGTANVVGDVTRLPFSDNQFDCVTALGNSLSLLSDNQVDLVFQQVERSTKPHGLLILDLPDFDRMKNGNSPLATPIKKKKAIYSKTLGNGWLHWNRYYDPDNNRIHSREELVFNGGEKDEKRIEHHFQFHLISPQRVTRKAEKRNMEPVAIQAYHDTRGKYRGMLSKRVFMIFRKK